MRLKATGIGFNLNDSIFCIKRPDNKVCIIDMGFGLGAAHPLLYRVNSVNNPTDQPWRALVYITAPWIQFLKWRWAPPSVWR